MTDALTVRGLRVTRGAREILTGVDLHARAGDVVALMGLSGSGKTTILRVIAGLEPCDAGDVHAAKVGMVFQFHYLFEHLSAIENVTLAPAHVHGVARDEARRRAQTLLDQLGVGHRGHALPRELSGGEAQPSPERWRSIPRCCCSTSPRLRWIRRGATSWETPSRSSRDRAVRS